MITNKILKNPLITKTQAQQFAHQWVQAWNAHDLERVLSHYTADFEMSSPFIIAITGEPSGTLKGHKQVGAYWRTSLERIPNLHFELLEVFTCINSIIIYYKSVFGKLAAEVFFINHEGKAYKAFAHYNG